MAGVKPPSLKGPTSSPPIRRAVEYVRMSTDQQKYSTEDQSDAIRKYASERGFELVRSYADAGKSGLRIEGREALRQLILDMQDGTAPKSGRLFQIIRRRTLRCLGGPGRNGTLGRGRCQRNWQDWLVRWEVAGEPRERPPVDVCSSDVPDHRHWPDGLG